MAISIIRRPRPMGLTQLSLEYQKSPNEETLNKVYIYLINQWYINTGNICGVNYDMNSLSSTFGIPKNYISNFMMNSVVNSHVWDKEHQEEIINGLLGEQLTWALEDRMEIVNQVNLLKISQGGKYTPFITAELNKALKLRLESSTSLQSIIRNLVGSGTGGTLNIFQQFNQQNNVQDVEYVTVNDALKMIQEVNVNDKSDEVKYLESQYDIGSLPEVIATKQLGVDVSKEGLNSNKDKLLLEAITDDYQGAIKLSSKEHHEIRREIEENIDPYEDDPELAFYEENPEEKDEITLDDITHSHYLN